jgi:hypothetical protein
MINIYDQVPSVYINTSRDFQYLSWLINIVLNSVKHNIDDMYDLPNTKSDPRLTELLATTLGFKVRRIYDNKQLAALVSIIPSILKYKGTLKAVTLAAQALINASGTSDNLDETDRAEMLNNVLEVTLPEELVDVSLFTDLLPYIAPAGVICRVLRERRVKLDPLKSDIAYKSRYHAEWEPILGTTENNTGLSEMFKVSDATGEDITKRDPIFSNYYKDVGNNFVLNTGLLDNSMIPSLGNEDTKIEGQKEEE